MLDSPKIIVVPCDDNFIYVIVEKTGELLFSGLETLALAFVEGFISLWSKESINVTLYDEDHLLFLLEGIQSGTNWFLENETPF